MKKILYILKIIVTKYLQLEKKRSVEYLSFLNGNLNVLLKYVNEKLTIKGVNVLCTIICTFGNIYSEYIFEIYIR